MPVADNRALVGSYKQLRARQRRLLITVLVCADVAALAVAVLAAGILRSSIDSVLPVATLGWIDRHVIASVIAVPVLVALFWLSGHYNIDDCLVGTRDYANTAHSVTYGLIIALTLSYFSGGAPLVSRSWLLLVWGISILFVGLERFIARRIVRRIRARGFLPTRVVIVGASTFGVAVAEQLMGSAQEGIQVAGFLDEYLPLGQVLLPGVAVIGRPDDLLQRTQVDAVDEFIFVPQALPHERFEEITRLMAFRDGPVLRMAISSRDLLTHGLSVTTRGHVPLVMLQRARLSGVDQVLKRALDISGALLALLAMSPLVALVLVRGYWGGKRTLFVPELIRAPGGGTTRLWLLADEISGRLPIRGAPALLAVLSGELSLVGPRPRRWDAGERAAGSPSLTALPPGLTGPWRLSGPAASIEDQMLLDLAYARNYSIWEDLRIVWESARPGALLGRWHLGSVAGETEGTPAQTMPLPLDGEGESRPALVSALGRQSQESTS